jgi:hypothetical protein
LKELSIEGYAGVRFSGWVSSSSLQSLSLTDLPKLRAWWRMREAITTEHEQNYNLPLFPSFPSLSCLFIKNCPIRSIMADVAPGSQTIPSSSSPFSTLSKLKSLTLYDLEELEYLPEEWLQNLASLEILKIWECPKLQISMSRLFQHLPVLGDMQIEKCKKLSAMRLRNAVDLLHFVIYE